MILSVLHRTALMCSLTLTLGWFSSYHLHCQTSSLAPQRQFYAVPTPGLPIIPELHTDMTLEAFIGYVYLDSIARTIGIESAIRSPQNMTVHELRALSRYIYGMTDYNPALLLRHFTSTADSAFPSTRYASYPANTYFNFLLAVDKHGDEFGRDYALLVLSSYIIHVRVADVASGIDTTFGGQRPWTNVACDIIESFKGKVLPNNCIQALAITNGKEEPILVRSDCITYGFSHSEWHPAPKIGDEFVIFLFLQPLTLQKAIVYPMFGQEPSNGVFRIIDGKVQDIGNAWGLGTTPSFTDFRTNLLNKISTVKNWTW